MMPVLLSFLIIIPAAWFCYLPMSGHLRQKKGLTLAITLSSLFVTIAAAAFLTWKLDLGNNDLLLPILLLCFFAYHFSLRVEFYKTLAIFSVTAALMATLSNYAVCIEAAVIPSPSLRDSSPAYSLAQLGINLLVLLILAYPFRKYGGFLIDQPLSRNFWYAIILLAVTIFGSNIALYPVVYYHYHEQHTILNIVIVISAHLIIWLLMLVMLYFAVSSTLTARQMKEQNRILEMQNSQFQSQQRYMKASEKTRHDFRHSILTLMELYHNGDYDALGAYLDQYAKQMPVSETTVFCSDPALNALLNYFAHVSALNRIEFTARVNIPCELPISDVDLCNMVGNILENAVIACQKTEKKMIQLTILTEDQIQLYIVAVNTFDGIVRKRNEQYLSTNRNQDGIGLSSIASTAKSYGGIAQFSHEGNRFYSNVAIPLS